MDLRKSVSQNIVLFKLTGHWPVGPKLIYSIFSWFVLISMHLYNITSFLSIIMNETNLEILSKTVFNLIGTTGIAIKVVIFRKELNLLKDTLEILKEEEFQPNNAAQEQTVNDAMRKSKKLFDTFLILAAFVITSWIFTPILDKERILPTMAWFPFDYLSSSYYAYTYAWQSMNILFFAFTNTAIDTFFPRIAMLIGAQCDNLGNSIRELGSPENGVGMREAFLKCIKHHRLIIKFMTQIEKAYEHIILIRFIVSGSVTCETMFLLSLTSQLDATVFMLIAFQSVICTELLLYCWFGTQLNFKSDQLLDAVYDSNWYEFPLLFQKDLHLFMRLLQKPIVIRTIKIFPVSLASFMNIMRSSWVYFTALQKINNR